MEKEIGPDSFPQIDKVPEKRIRKALNSMQGHKRHAILVTISDYYINGPPELIFHLTSFN